MQNNKFETSIVNLASLKSFNFSIPTYQRPYVWQDEQVKKILDDFYTSYQQDKDNTYFIGTILTKEQSNEAELIDGQQRFTTLWLIAFIISRVCKNSTIAHFLQNEKGELRLGFEIRGEIKDFLEALLNEDDFQKEKFNEEFIEHYPYLKNIAKRLAFIKGYIDQKMPVIEIETFGNFIYDKVYLVKNVTPQKTDLNKLFSTINSAGVQLEQTDIIKANLLKRIDEKVLYGKIWETCENTNNFFERNARISFPKTDWHKINLEHCVEFDSTIFKYEDITLQNGNDQDDFTIDNVKIDDLKEYHQPNKIIADEKRESEEIYCRSIINFGQLLLHTYRLHLKKERKEDFVGTFHVNRLITIFKDLEDRNDADEIKRFFLLLWKVRHLFDKYIIKWISDVDNKTESLELVNFNKNDQSYYSRTKYAKNAALMLQSVLYFTGDYLRQFWLTSYLGYLLENHNNSDATDKKHLLFLEKMDNSFSLNDNLTDKEASWILINEDIARVFVVERYLNQSLGTGFKHYWFQKLEYILWKNWAFETTEEFNNFKILSKNSVEHIYPQNPANVQKSPPLEDEFLHAYGNLVLISVSQNSEYSRKSFDEKKGLFKNKNVFDTLKSYYIFQKDKWGKDEINEHSEEMISKIKEHYNLVSPSGSCKFY
jgi:uncharacterized protein with ParB-like and HNH nuclease domain